METRRWLFSLLLCQPMRKYISTLDRSLALRAAPVMIMRLSDDGESCLVLWWSVALRSSSRWRKSLRSMALRLTPRLCPQWMAVSSARQTRRESEGERARRTPLKHFETASSKGVSIPPWIRAARHARLRDTRGRRGERFVLAFWPKSGGFEMFWGVLFWGRCAVGDGYRLMVPTKSLTTSPTSLTWLIARAGRCSGVRAGQFKTSVSGIFFYLSAKRPILMLLIEDGTLSVIDVVVARSSWIIFSLAGVWLTPPHCPRWFSLARPQFVHSSRDDLLMSVK